MKGDKTRPGVLVSELTQNDLPRFIQKGIMIEAINGKDRDFYFIILRVYMNVYYILMLSILNGMTPLLRNESHTF